ncbi:acyl-CoA dehydrogenase [Rhodococcus sp. Leaf7]|uniref:acyl-CoA dehydrogenase family protein n=1 Tax=unclassified Rhodococcus (in: high G+C Gram-positive bacteria) TaxID=192944 RepID=UPI0006F265BE|nr:MULTISPECIES: acyl-CoA dehydrogenase family protein [unclassified Rhodococcus (in: high G+C Gram-positive bacteria)]KQU07899.1 acyl-CoA dehydrogenase [Rhodococcus sp. Leaf7]KQU43418.1 acyl-CoA dehydrogenase [Rhodococcus sp. Leaf247]
MTTLEAPQTSPAQAVGLDLMPLDEVLAVVRSNAELVDREGRFPAESVQALRAAGLLSASVPKSLGGAGMTLTELATVSRALGGECASTAMIFAMHHTQVMSLSRHGLESPVIRDFLASMVTDQPLVASATTEINIGGDVRSSSCAVEYEGDRYTLTKNAPVISYGEYADVVLATARRSPESAPSDQVLVACLREDVTLQKTGTWDTMGFRGTCSPGFMLRASGSAEWVVPATYSDISAQTMLPTAHVLWGGAWLGIADAAVRKARKSVQKLARKTPGVTPPSAARLAELLVVHQQLSDTVFTAGAKFDAISDDPAALGAIGFALSINNVKVTASDLLIDIVARALLICGIAGYREDSELRMSRHLRDSHGSAIMVSNERILNHNAQLSLVYKGL